MIATASPALAAVLPLYPGLVDVEASRVANGVVSENDLASSLVLAFPEMWMVGDIVVATLDEDNDTADPWCFHNNSFHRCTA